VVRVKGPLNLNRGLELICWLIEPVKAEPWCVTAFDCEFLIQVVTFDKLIEHPDAWLMPLGPSTPAEEEREELPRRLPALVE